MKDITIKYHAEAVETENELRSALISMGWNPPPPKFHRKVELPTSAGILRSDEFEGHVFEPSEGMDWPFENLYTEKQMMQYAIDFADQCPIREFVFPTDAQIEEAMCMFSLDIDDIEHIKCRLIDIMKRDRGFL